jgi:hypothetical protein
MATDSEIAMIEAQQQAVASIHKLIEHFSLHIQHYSSGKNGDGATPEGCFGTAGTFGSIGGTCGTAGTFGCGTLPKVEPAGGKAK